LGEVAAADALRALLEEAGTVLGASSVSVWQLDGEDGAGGATPVARSHATRGAEAAEQVPGDTAAISAPASDGDGGPAPMPPGPPTAAVLREQRVLVGPPMGSSASTMGAAALGRSEEPDAANRYMDAGIWRGGRVWGSLRVERAPTSPAFNPAEGAYLA